MNAHIEQTFDPTAQSLARLYKALAHPIRLSLLYILTQEEACVCHLMCALQRPQPYISQQLSILRSANLVTDRREGQVVFYAVTDPTVTDLIQLGLHILGKDAGFLTLPVEAGKPLADCSCPKCMGQ